MDSPSPTSSQQLPTTANTREYLVIEPSDESIESTQLENAFRRLHRDEVTVEWLLVSDGDSISYYVGAEQTDTTRLQHILRQLFPAETTITTTDCDPTARFRGAENLQALTVEGKPARSDDWQLPLKPVDRTTTEATPIESAPLALGSVVEALATADTPVLYQLCSTPKPNWQATLTDRRRSLATNSDTPLQWLSRDEQSSSTESTEPTLSTSGIPANDRRLAALETVSPRTTFSVTVRAVATGARATHVLGDIGAAITNIAGPQYGLETTHYSDSTEDGPSAQTILANLTARRPRTPTRWTRLKHRIPGLENREPRLIVDVDALGHFCLFDAETVSEQALRTTDHQPHERTDIPSPDPDISDQYRQPGLTLGVPTGRDDHSADEISLPPSLQTLHTAWFGKTGAGKSMSLTNAILDNQQATAGADILIDPKGDGLPEDYLRAHYAEHGHLENVYYFDCARTLPAISFFDIRGATAAGIPRQNAVADTVDHYIEILRALMGAERFDQAVRSPDIIRYLVRALFDPIHGSDAFGHSELHTALTRMHEERDPPTVADDDLASMLGGVAANSKRSFDELMQGVANRVEKIPLDRRLATIFDHTPTGDDPEFDFAEILDEDAVIIFDTGSLRPASREALTLVFLSNLWQALKRRARTTESTDRPLVNLYLEEAATVTATDLLSELLAQSRGFDLGVTLAMQFPDQLRDGAGTADEILNNVSTIVTGNVPADRGLAQRFVTEDMSQEAVGARLRALERGEWFTTLPSAFGEAEPRPFVLESTPLPPGHDAGPRPLTDTEQTQFAMAHQAVTTATREELGLAFESTSPVRTESDVTSGDDIDASMPLAEAMSGDTTVGPSGPPNAQPDSDSQPANSSAQPDSAGQPTPSAQPDSDSQPANSNVQPAATQANPAVHPRTNTNTTDDPSTTVRTEAQRDATATVDFHTDTTLPHTQRLPECLRYDGERHALCCVSCEKRYDPTADGIHRAIECCHTLADVDRDNVPTVTINLKLTRAEQAASEYSVRQLCFLQLVHTAQHRRYAERFEFDLVRDSMVRLEEYLDIEDAAVDELKAADLLRQDTNHPHRLYSVTAAGREEIGEATRAGLDHGPGAGDLSESSEHAMAVELGRRYIESEFVGDVTSPVVEAAAYYPIGNNSRLDAVGLDDDGDVVITVEAERSNNDLATGVPSDYDKMAAQEPSEAIWIAMNRAGAHDVLRALNEPAEGTPRVEKTYSDSTAPQRFTINRPGCTSITTVGSIRNQLLE